MNRDHAGAAVDPALERARRTAVERHEREAQLFADRYREMGRDRFASGFTYGRSKIDRLLEGLLAGVPPGGTAVDVGCGTGEQLRQFRDLGLRPIGIEPAVRMREIARAANPDVEVLDGSILEIPLHDDSADFVSAIEVLRYLKRPDWDRAVREMLRVLKPGGLMFVTLVNRYALDGFSLFHAGREMLRRLARRPPGTHHEFVTPAEARQILEMPGALDVETRGLMLAPLRLAYKVHPRLGSGLSRRIDRIDDAVSIRPWHVPVAGHLVVTARKPARSGPG